MLSLAFFIYLSLAFPLLSLSSLEVIGQADVTHGSAAVTIRATLVDDISGIRTFRIRLEGPAGKDSEFAQFNRADLLDGSYLGGIYEQTLDIDGFVEPGDWTIELSARDNSGNGMNMDAAELAAAGFPGTVRVINRGPSPYLFASDLSFPDGWRSLDWFGWLQDAETFPYVLHAEHGWIYALDATGDGFWVYDYGTELWWAVYEEFYPFIYVLAEEPRWLYYYAPFGSPGNRWFYDFGAERTNPRARSIPDSHPDPCHSLIRILGATGHLETR